MKVFDSAPAPVPSRYPVRRSLIVIAGLLILMAADAYPSPDGVRRATTDLRDYSFEDSPLVPLAGSWEIYWGKLLTPESAAAPDGLFTMPGTWNEWPPGPEAVGGIGHATFAVRVLLPETMTRGALLLSPASTAYRLWANGTLVAESGVPGTSRNATTPHYAVRRAVFEAPEHVLNLTLQVANYHHRRGGMWRPIYLGSVEHITSRSMLETTYDLLLVGSFLAMAIYNLVLYRMGGGKNKTPLWLCALFLVLVVRNLVMGQMIATQVFTRFPWGAQLRIEYLTSHLALLTVVMAIREAYRAYMPVWFIGGVRVLVGANALTVLIFSIRFYSQIVGWYVYLMLAVLAFVVLLLLRARVRGDRGVWPGVAAVIIALLITLNDLLLFSHAVLSREFAPFGFLVPLLVPDAGEQATAYILSTVLNLVLVFAAANMIVIKSTRSLVTVGAGETLAMQLTRPAASSSDTPAGSSASPSQTGPAQGDAADTGVRRGLTKYARSGLTAAEAEEIYREVVAHLEATAIYRDPHLSLSELARAVGIGRHHLSQVVNSKTSGNFYAFINRFRIEDFANRITRGDHHSYTLAALAEACGFSSYATFFNTLKRMTGERPREYVTRVEREQQRAAR